jgi:hypothetical protein
MGVLGRNLDRGWFHSCPSFMVGWVECNTVGTGIGLILVCQIISQCILLCGVLVLVLHFSKCAFLKCFVDYNDDG